MIRMFDEIGMPPPLASEASRGNYPMIRMMKSDDANGIVPPLAYFASGGNYPMIRMMKSEWLLLLPLLLVGETIQ